MSITELALMQASSTSAMVSLKDIFVEENKVINTWATSKHELNFTGTWLFTQVEDPSVLMMVAQWKDTNAHGEWLVTNEHNRALPRIMPLMALDAEGKPKAEMWYLEDNIFETAGEEAPLLESPIISVGRYQVATKHRDAFKTKYRALKSVLDRFTSPHVVRGAWKLETGKEERQAEFVIVIGWPSVERRQELGKVEGLVAHREVIDFVEDVEVRHYQRFL